MQIPNTILRSHPLAVHRSDVKNKNGDELVIISDYNTSTGELGYFVVWERYLNGLYDYSQVEHFFKRENDQAFAVALETVRNIVAHVN